MMPIDFELELFNGQPYDERRSRHAVLWLIEALVGIDYQILQMYPHTPGIYESHVLYRHHRENEPWQDILTTLRKGHGDCKDFAAYRCAELRMMGIAAKPYLRWHDDRPHAFHALVKMPDGRIEDPSLALGMGGHPIVRQPLYVDPG